MSMRLGRCLVGIVAAAFVLGLEFASGARADDVLSFHVPDRQFQPAEVPNWIWDRPLETVVVSLEQIDVAAKAGIQIAHIANGGAAYYPLKRDDPKSGMPAKNSESLKAQVARCNGYGMKTICAMWPYPPQEMMKMHPEWIGRSKDDDSIEKEALADPTKLIGMCFNSPWGDHLVECMAEIVHDYKVDGFSFDGGYHPYVCYCKSCKEKYKKETGRDIPAKVDLENIDYRIYLLWFDGKLEDWYRRANVRLRQVNPEAAMCTWTTNAGRFGHFLTSPRVMSQRLNMLFGLPVQEWWLDEANQGGSVIPAFGAAYMRAVTGNRVGACEPYFMSRGNPYGDDSLPAHETFCRAMLAITNGSLCAEYIGQGPRALSDFKAVRQRSKWLTRIEQMPWAAMLFSEQTRQFYGLTQVYERYLPHPLGVFRTAMEEHLPLNIITDWESVRPERLAKYKVLVLPNAACLSNDQLETIRNYVRNGGGLVASCDTSFFDEIGRPRGAFGLADLFGVSYQGRAADSAKRADIDLNFARAIDESYWKNRTGVNTLTWSEGSASTKAILQDPRLNELVPGRRVTFKGPAVKVSEPKDPAELVMRMSPEGQTQSMPAVIMRTYGKGRVVYMPAGLDAGYYSYWYPYERRVLAAAMQWAAREAFPIEVKAPMCVQTTFFEQSNKEGRRLVIHLYNGMISTAQHGKPDVDVPLREESVPIAGVSLRFQGLPITRFHLEPEGKTLEAKKDGNAVVVEIPPLAVHSMLIGELE
jgi:hypothetical protein